MEVHTIHLKQVDSTNTWAKEHVQEFDPKKITCIAADEQTAGRGRNSSRHWVSKKGNLFFSVFFCLAPGDACIPNLSQLLAFSICTLLRKQQIDVLIKWPNDLVIQGEKLGGILVELVQIHKQIGVIAGVGLNVNTPIETTQPTTSLYQETERIWEPDLLRNQIISSFQNSLDEGFSPKLFQQYLAYCGETITCDTGKEMLTGTLAGVTEQGYLQLETAKGVTRTFASGDIHRLRKH